MNEKSQTLSTFPLFSELPKRSLRKIARLVDAVSVPAGATILEEGSFTREVYFVVAGTVEVQRSDRAVARLTTGDHFGELSLIDGRPRSASVVAVTPVDLLVMGKQQFNALLDSQPGVARHMMADLSVRLRSDHLPKGQILEVG